jgi:hypothetical protein
MAAAIHVVPDDNFDDWVVRNDNGHGFGHYPTREAADPVRSLRSRIHLMGAGQSAWTAS